MKKIIIVVMLIIVIILVGCSNNNINVDRNMESNVTNQVQKLDPDIGDDSNSDESISEDNSNDQAIDIDCIDTIDELREYLKPIFNEGEEFHFLILEKSIYNEGYYRKIVPIENTEKPYVVGEGELDADEVFELLGSFGIPFYVLGEKDSLWVSIFGTTLPVSDRVWKESEGLDYVILPEGYKECAEVKMSRDIENADNATIIIDYGNEVATLNCVLDEATMERAADFIMYVNEEGFQKLLR